LGESPGFFAIPGVARRMKAKDGRENAELDPASGEFVIAVTIAVSAYKYTLSAAVRS